MSNAADRFWDSEQLKQKTKDKNPDKNPNKKQRTPTIVGVF